MFLKLLEILSELHIDVFVLCVRAGCRRTGEASSVPLLLRPDGEEEEEGIKEKEDPLPLHCHFTSRQKPHHSIPPVGEREREERTALTTTTTTTNETMRRTPLGGGVWGGGGGGEEEEKWSADERGEVLLIGDVEV